jgi:hypothetical protein
VLIVGRGLIDGECMGHLKQKLAIDSIVPLRSDMDLYADAIGLTRLRGTYRTEGPAGLLKQVYCLSRRSCAGVFRVRAWDQWYTLGAAVVAFYFRFMVPGSEIMPGFWITQGGCSNARPNHYSLYFYPGSHRFGLRCTSV